MSGVCNWDSSEVDWATGSDSWSTACGNTFVFTSDGPAENHFMFCPYCGLELVDLNAHMQARKVEASHAS